MILTCQKCSTSFRLDETLLKATGSKVRCSLCQNIWVAYPPQASDEELDTPAEGDTVRGAAGLAASGVALGAIAAGLAEDDADDAETPEAMPPELKFFADEDIEETPTDDDDMVTDEINLDELDQLLSEDAGPVSQPLPDEDFKTEELNLADLEKMLDFDNERPPSVPADEPAAPQDLDFGEALLDDAASEAADKEDSVIEELDLDLEDLENLLEEDTGLSDEIAAAEETAAGAETADAEAQDAPAAAADEIELDMDAGLEDLLKENGREPVVEETEDIGLSEISDALDEAETPSEQGVGDDQDLDFELAPGLDGIFDEDEGRDVPLEETEELDFSALEADLAGTDEKQSDDDQELQLALEDGPEADRKDAPDDLDDLALALEEDDESGRASGEEDLPELDLSDLDKAFAEGGLEAPGAAEEAEELELDMDMDAGSHDAPDELDLLLEDEGQPEGAGALQEPGDVPEETRELGSDELESLLEGVEDAAEDAEEPSSDSLELDFDLDSLDDEGGDEMDDATRELDLNDIEKILEMEGAEDGTAEEAVAESEDLDLDLDMDSVAPPVAATEETGEETTDANGALDLSELEKMLDVEDTTDAPAGGDEDMDDLDLDFELQPTTEESDDLDLEFDMLDEEPVQASALFDTSESEDLGLDLEHAGEGGAVPEELDTDLDFEIMDDDLAVQEVDLDTDAEDIGAATLSDPLEVAPSGGPRSRDLTQELMDEMAAADTQTMAAPPIETKPIKPAPPPFKRKKKSSKALVLLFILVLLGGAGYLLPKYTGLQLPGIKLPDLSGIPIIGEYFGSPSREAVVPVEASLKGDWVQNQQAGRLYAIQGRVKNDYNSPRSYIRVTGRVYANGRKFQRAAKAYCGNIITADELASLPLADIQKKLSNRAGLDNSNVKVAPGQEVAFMVVFGDLPPDVELQEFAVEISGSLPVSSQ